MTTNNAVLEWFLA